MKLDVMPRCVGQYEADHKVCDGDGASKVPAERLACPHRDVCVAVRLRMEETGRARSAYVVQREDNAGNPYAAPRNPEAFQRIVKHTLRRYGVADGRATTRPKATASRGRRLAPADTGVARRGKSKGKPRPPRSQAAIEMDPWYDEWLAYIVRATGREVARLPVEARPGQLYVRDQRRLSYYVAVYCKARRGRDVPIGCLLWRPRFCSIDVKFSVPPGEWVGIGRDTMRMLKPVAHNDGVWVAMASLCDIGRVRLSAEVLARLICGGILKLPEAS